LYLRLLAIAAVRAVVLTLVSSRSRPFPEAAASIAVDAVILGGFVTPNTWASRKVVSELSRLEVTLLAILDLRAEI
jgi:hypothetical protein